MNMNPPHFVWTTKSEVNRKAAAEIDAAVKSIDPSMYFVRHYEAGNDTHGWLERSSDGTNDYAWRREKNNKCIAIARKALGGAK